MPRFTTFFKIPQVTSPFIEAFTHHNAMEALKINPQCVMVHARRKQKADIEVKDVMGPDGKAAIPKDNTLWEEYAWIEDPPEMYDTMEFKGMVYDPSFDYNVTREAWYEMYDFKDIHRYNVDEAVNELVRTGHVGPWLEHREKPLYISTGKGIPQELINKFEQDREEALRKKEIKDKKKND
jgi:hypothetical protein